MKNISKYSTKDKKKISKDTFLQLIPRRRYSFKATEDFLQGAVSILPSSMIDRDLSVYVTHSYLTGLQSDWDRVGDDMWLSISKFAANNFR